MKIMKSDRSEKRILSGLVIFALTLSGGRSILRADALDKIAKKISAGATKLQNKKIAVLPFPYHDGRESQGSTIVSERLITKLVEQKKLDVIERSLMEKVLKELKLQSSGAIDEQSAKQIGKILGVDAVVSGTLIDVEDSVEVNARLIKVETGQIIVASSGKVKQFWQESMVKPQEDREPMRSGGEPPPQMASRDSRDGEAHMPFQNRPPMQPMDDEDNGSILQGPLDMLMIETETGHEVQTPMGQQILEGIRLLKRNDGVRAEEHFSRLHQQFQDRPKVNAVIRIGYSLSLFEQGKKDKAIREAMQVAEQKEWPRISATAHFFLGKYAEDLGKPKEAKEHYLQVVRLVPFRTVMVDFASRQLRMLEHGGMNRAEPDGNLRSSSPAP